MIIDGYSILFLITASLLVIVILVIAIQRQIFRLRNNNVRREQNISIGVGMTKNQRSEVLRRIELVRQFQLLRAPKFTEIGTIAQHANAPYINRMITLDELREIDRQLEFINRDLVRIAGESTYSYLTRMKRIALPTLPDKLIERLGFLAEHCRFRHQPFTEKELTEVRTLIKDVVRILNSEQQRLSALHLKTSDTGSGVGPVLSASLHSISKRLSTGENKLAVRKKTSSGMNSHKSTSSGRWRSKAGRDSFHKQKSKQLSNSNQIERAKQQWHPTPHARHHHHDLLPTPQNDSEYDSSALLVSSFYEQNPSHECGATKLVNSESIPLIAQCLRNRSETVDSQHRKHLRTSTERVPLLQSSVNSSS